MRSQRYAHSEVFIERQGTTGSALVGMPTLSIAHSKKTISGSRNSGGDGSDQNKIELHVACSLLVCSLVQLICKLIANYESKN